MQLSNTTWNKERSILVLFLLNLNQANGKRLVINRGNPSVNIICLKRNHIFATYTVYSVSSKQLGRSCTCLDRVNAEKLGRCRGNLRGYKHSRHTMCLSGKSDQPQKLNFFSMLTLNKSLDKSVSCFLENLPKTLREFHVGNSARLKADDFLQSYQLILNVVHR